MLLFFILVMYVVLHIFAAYEVYVWLKDLGGVFERKSTKAVLIMLYVIFAMLLIIAIFLPPQSELKKLLSRIGNYYEGVFINTLIVIVVAHLGALILKLLRIIPKDFFRKGKAKHIGGLVCLICVIVLSVYGCVNANYIQKTEYNVAVNKAVSGDNKNMRIVLISDLHLGYNLGYRNMEKMAEEINELQPDLVCIAGDIFDNSYDALDNPQKIAAALSSIKSTYGTYACWGNHDINDKLLMGFTVNNSELKLHDERMAELLKAANVHLLEDETEVIDNKFTLIGRLDKHKPGTEDNTRKSIDEFSFDKSLPVIVIDHEPNELQELADAGIDLDLCGHTHNGQIFPLTLTSQLIWENSAGYLQKTGKDGNTMHNYVTEGVGVYGPFMRTGCKSEIMCINVQFK
jgi:hypothetical protein